jgi:addiction module HigA family antidote
VQAEARRIHIARLSRSIQSRQNALHLLHKIGAYPAAITVLEQTLQTVNGNSGISPEMAVRLSKAFGGGPAVWLKMQMDYDFAQVEKNAGKIKVRRVLQPA